jgi:hypothetical protein
MAVRLEVIYTVVVQVVHDQVISEVALQTDLQVAALKSIRGHELLMELQEEFTIREPVKLSGEEIIQRKVRDQVLAVNAHMVIMENPKRKHILDHHL